MPRPLFAHLFWDFDGTLYDSYGAMTRAMQSALRDAGYSAPYAEVYTLLKQSVYHASLTLAERFSLPVEVLQAGFRCYHNQIHTYPLFEGVQDCLAALHRQGCRHYLYTHRDCGAIHQLARDGLAPLFSAYVTRDDSFPDKPAPDALNALMAQYRIAPSQAAIIGDRDLDAGHNAQIAGILFDPQNFFPHLAAEYRVNSFAEITMLISNGVP